MVRRNANSTLHYILYTELHTTFAELTTLSREGKPLVLLCCVPCPVSEAWQAAASLVMQRTTGNWHFITQFQAIKQGRHQSKGQMNSLTTWHYGIPRPYILHQLFTKSTCQHLMPFKASIEKSTTFVLYYILSILRNGIAFFNMCC